MAASPDVVVALDGQVIDPTRPVLFADDPMVTRGDGVFETLLVRGGRARLLDAHLARLARSAAIVGLPEPDPARWRRAVVVGEERWADPDDAVMRLVLGRGRGAEPTAFVTVSALPARVPAARRDGVSAITLDRGVPARPGAAAPWSIVAAKSLSYAFNAAALRHAERVGVGDVVLVSSDGYVLEGPRSSVVIETAGGELVTPPTTSPILAGTTVQAVLEVARARGVPCSSRPLMTTDLLAAQGLWLLSSLVLAARVHTLDGTSLPTPTESGEMASLVDDAVGGPR